MRVIVASRFVRMDKNTMHRATYVSHQNQSADKARVITLLPTRASSISRCASADRNMMQQQIAASMCARFANPAHNTIQSATRVCQWNNAAQAAPLKCVACVLRFRVADSHKFQFLEPASVSIHSAVAASPLRERMAVLYRGCDFETLHSKRYVGETYEK